MDQVVTAFAKAYPRAVFVQIGANDGEQRDPLRASIARRQWSGVMVEPVPYVFARLQAHYEGHPRVKLANVAVAAADGTRVLFYLPESRDPGLPRWYDALASFQKDVVLSHDDAIPDVAERLTSMEVPCVTFDTLCRQQALERVDLIQIDTEGYDYEVIKSIDLARHAPLLLMYESLHLSEHDRGACLALLHSQGYESLSDGMDTVCLRADALRRPQVRHVWRRLQRVNR